MAVIRPMNQEDELDPLTGAPKLSSGGPGAEAGGSPTGAAPVQAPAAKQEQGGFINLRNYLDANEGKGQEMGNQLMKPINQTAQKIDAQPDPVAPTPYPTVEPVQTTPVPAPIGGAPIDQNPLLASAAPKSEQYAAAGKDAGRLENSATRKVLLKDASPTATEGENNFDNFLTGREGGSFEALRKSLDEKTAGATKNEADYREAVKVRGANDRAEYDRFKGAEADKKETERQAAVQEEAVKIHAEATQRNAEQFWGGSTGGKHYARPDFDTARNELFATNVYGPNHLEGLQLTNHTYAQMTDAEVGRMYGLSAIERTEYLREMNAKYSTPREMTLQEKWADPDDPYSQQGPEAGVDYGAPTSHADTEYLNQLLAMFPDD